MSISAMAALLVALYAIVSRTVKFPIGASYSVPSYPLRGLVSRAETAAAEIVAHVHQLLERPAA